MQQLRRVDFFLVDGRMTPPASTLAETKPTYEDWCRQARVDASLPNVFDTRIAVVDGRALPIPGLGVEVLESDESGTDAASVASGSTNAKGYFTVQLPRGFYGLRTQIGDEVLGGALAIDPDLYGAQRVAFVASPRLQEVETE
jgi:hypothetical protein